MFWIWWPGFVVPACMVLGGLGWKCIKRLPYRRKEDLMPEQLRLALDPVKATEYRNRKNKSDDEACSMCGDYCAVKIVGKYLEEHMRKK